MRNEKQYYLFQQRNINARRDPCHSQGIPLQVSDALYFDVDTADASVYALACFRIYWMHDMGSCSTLLALASSCSPVAWLKVRRAPEKPTDQPETGALLGGLNEKLQGKAWV